jgi:hypothetical protein
MFEWIRVEGVMYGEYSMQWKRDLAREIQEMIRIYEGREVKFESVYRNLNRMISYYDNTGAQARSGRKYLPYLENIFNRHYQRALTASRITGGGIAHRFLDLQSARIYASDIPVLKIYPHPDSRTFEILRIY